MGVQCMMLTGDNRLVAKWVAEELGLDDYFAEVLPQEKAGKGQGSAGARACRRHGGGRCQ